MEAMDIILATFSDIAYLIANHPVYSVLGCITLLIGMLRFYCKLIAGVCYSDQDMTGKTVLITGATAGIGKPTAMDMARRNARVILACRNTEKARRVADEITSSTGNKNVIVKHLDFASLKSVRKCAADILNSEEKLHVLINNAGIFCSTKPITEDGYETVIQSNHLGPFLLTLLLLDLLKKSAPSRIINVSSESYKFGKLDLDDMEGEKCKSDLQRYARSKLANVLFTIELASQLENSGVTVNALHPGIVRTDIFLVKTSLFLTFAKFLHWLVGKSPDEGAQTTIYLAVHPEVEKTTGKYFADCKEEKILPKKLNKVQAKKLFELSRRMVGIDVQQK